MKNWIRISLWSLFAIALIFLAISAQQHINNQLLPEPEIHIHVEDENAFLTKEELYQRLRSSGLCFDQQKKEELDIAAVETFVRSISQVKQADVYQFVNGNWKIDVYIRKPIARLFNNKGESYYLDSEGNTMQIKPSHTARVLVVTGDFRDDPKSISVPEIINNDSLKSIRKLDDIYRISNYVCKDPLFHSLLGQVHLEKNGDFVIIPIVGEQKIIFGSAYSDREVEKKFEKLRVFYEEAMPYAGWDTYSEISLKYRDQIVCKKKQTNE